MDIKQHRPRTGSKSDSGSDQASSEVVKKALENLSILIKEMEKIGRGEYSKLLASKFTTEKYENLAAAAVEAKKKHDAMTKEEKEEFVKVWAKQLAEDVSHLND
mgnify:FL=1